ncbi:MAG: hypothetical protein IJR68_09960 [Fretibacterium sp.]|nr:hypothetical protein [Fretibacterium sp.]
MLATVELKKWNDVTVLPIPSVFLSRLDLKPDMPMSLQVLNDSLVLRPQKKHYSLDDLLVGEFRQDDESRAWTQRVPRGQELL